jgi:histidinol-phosphate/aromatic aminotransferase/cobyric acid decarboxylase-like protein
VSLPIPPPGPHGGDGPALARALGIDPAEVLDLSQSLNPFAPDPTPLVAGVAGAVRHYPDLTTGEAVLAEAMGVDPTRLVLTNGGSEAIALVATEVPRGAVVEPEFSLYQRHVAIDPTGPRWRSNPNNPLGTLAGPDDTAAVWDEAFWPLSTGTWTRGDADRGAWVVGSLTKLLACPGLRLGYVLAPDTDGADRLRSRRPEWSVNGLALASLPRLLATVDLPGWAGGISAARDDLVRTLGERGLAARPTDAPWVLVDGARWLRDALAPHAILVRDCTSFGLDAVRLAIPHPDHLPRLAAALDRILT